MYISSGVPQGSVLGPSLWNTMSDGVLQLEGIGMIAYADDLAAVIKANTEADLEDKASKVLGDINKWMQQEVQATESKIIKKSDLEIFFDTVAHRTRKLRNIQSMRIWKFEDELCQYCRNGIDSSREHTVFDIKHGNVK